MNNKDFGKKIEERTKAFAIRIIKLSTLLPVSTERKVLRNQITKSGTSMVLITGKQIGPEAELISLIK